MAVKSFANPLLGPGGEVISLGVTETSILAVVISGQRPFVTQGTFPFLPAF